MSTNVSKEKREELLAKVKEIRTFIASAEQDDNTANLLAYLSELERDVGGKKYGLVFEEHREEIDEKLITHTPVLIEDGSLFIDNGDQMNFLIEGDNLASLKLLEKTHKGKIDLIYIDPPYNTGAKDWKYNNEFVDSNDTFRHSKWLSMMNVRLKVAKRLLSKNGAMVCAIDENEQATVGLLLEEIFGEAYNIDCITVVHNPGGIQGTNFSYCHEYAYFIYPHRSYYIQKERRVSDDLTPFRDWGKENSKRTGSPNCFYPIITDGEKILSFGNIPPNDFHPASANEIHGDILWIWPIDKNGVERRWRFARDTVETIKDELKVTNIRGELNVQRNKQFYTRKTVWNDARYSANVHGTQLLSQLIDTKFPFPKSLYLVEECIKACEQSKAYTVLDFFAGSGTTGHAVMKLNAEDGGNRHFILCTNNENNICREVTYERIKSVIDKEGYAASLKYYKVGYIPMSERMYYEYADELLAHIRELVELENGINFTGNAEIGIVLTEDELAEFIANGEAFAKCRKLYMGHDLLPDEEQEQILRSRGVAISIIPDYYYRDLQEG